MKGAKTVRWLAFCVVFSLAQSAFAQGVEDPGFLRGEELRYQNTNVFLRTLADIPALPTAFVDWTATDWAIFSGVVVSVGTLMAPLGPPLDVRFDDWVTKKVDPWFPDVWGTRFQAPFWVVVGAAGFSTWGFSALRGHDDIAESMSLAGESLAAFQFYHLTLKLAIGRDNEYEFHGFPESLKLFPKGTPGGHFGTMYALYGALEAYWDPAWYVRVPAHVTLFALAFTHALNHRHFLSDQIWGASMGYAISKWVVHHRSTRYVYGGDGKPVRIAVVPMERGLGVAGVF